MALSPFLNSPYKVASGHVNGSTQVVCIPSTCGSASFYIEKDTGAANSGTFQVEVSRTENFEKYSEVTKVTMQASDLDRGAMAISSSQGYSGMFMRMTTANFTGGTLNIYVIMNAR